MPLVSVIIPCRDAAPRIVECLSSVVAQRDADTEIILVDDHSLDDGISRACEIMRSVKRPVKVLDGGGRGVSHARNLGLASAQGDFIQWLDADDVLPEASKLALQIAAINSEPSALAVSDYAWMDVDIHPQRFRPAPVQFSQDVLLDTLLGTMPQLGAFLFPRVLANRLAALGGFDETTVLGEDREYITLAAMLGGRFIHVPIVGVLYMQWSKVQLSRRVSAFERGAMMARVFERLTRHAASLDVQLSEVHRYLLTQDWSPHRWAIKELLREPWWKPAARLESGAVVALSPIESVLAESRGLDPHSNSLEALARGACEVFPQLGYRLLAARRSIDGLCRRGVIERVQ